MPRFSVIIPTYNRLELLREALASVWAQTFTDYEVIVVEDGSSDGTWEYLQSLGSRVRAFRQQNAGPGAARNLGAKHATGEYLAFLDSDDLWLPWSLKVFSSLIDKNDLPAILSGKLSPFTASSEIAVTKEMPVQMEFFQDYFSASCSGYFAGAGMSVLSRSAFMNTGGYTDKPVNCEDHDLTLKMGDAHGFVQVLSPVTLGWRRHVGSATMSVPRSVEGSFFLIGQELLGAYPGGCKRARQRREIIARHVRPVVLDCLHKGMRKEAWALYRATFVWHVSLHRWKFLAGFLAKLALGKG